MPLTTLQPIRLRPSPPSDANISTLGKPYLSPERLDKYEYLDYYNTAAA